MPPPKNTTFTFNIPRVKLLSRPRGGGGWMVLSQTSSGLSSDLATAQVKKQGFFRWGPVCCLACKLGWGLCSAILKKGLLLELVSPRSSAQQYSLISKEKRAL
jgi:hypothetical protein